MTDTVSTVSSQNATNLKPDYGTRRLMGRPKKKKRKVKNASKAADRLMGKQDRKGY